MSISTLWFFFSFFLTHIWNAHDIHYFTHVFDKNKIDQSNEWQMRKTRCTLFLSFDMIGKYKASIMLHDIISWPPFIINYLWLLIFKPLTTTNQVIWTAHFCFSCPQNALCFVSPCAARCAVAVDCSATGVNREWRRKPGATTTTTAAVASRSHTHAHPPAPWCWYCCCCCCCCCGPSSSTSTI